MKCWFAPLSLFAALLVAACTGSPEQTSQENYFQLKEYFDREAARLQAVDPVIQKSVSIGHSAEDKKIRIESWISELRIFADADINKAAWQGMYNIEKEGETERYRATADDLPVRLIQIKKQNANIKGIEISIKNENALYTSTEQLNYYPDSLYEIHKSQAVRFTEPTTYKVKGIFINAQKQP